MAIVITERGGPNTRLIVCGFGGAAKASHTRFYTNQPLSLSHTHTHMHIHIHTHTFAKRYLDKLTPLVSCKVLDYRAKCNK